MSGFQRLASSAEGVAPWCGDPDDDAAHQAVLAWLQADVAPGTFLAPGSKVSNRVKGNLGEFVTYRLGWYLVFPQGMLCDTANAFDPLSDISRSYIDVVWLHLG